MSAERGCPHAEDAVGWTLHALEPADEEALNEHLPTCPACQDIVRQAQDAVWALVATSEQVDPPVRLRSALARGVAVTPQLPADARERQWGAGDPTDVSGDPAARWATPTPVVGPRHAIPSQAAPTGASGLRWARGRRRLVAMAATIAVALVGVGAVAVELVERVSTGEQSALAGPSPQANRILSDLDRAGVEHAVLHAPNGRVLAAVAVFSGQRQVMPIGLPANEADHSVYVLWGLGDGPPTPVGSFDVEVPSETMLPVGSAAVPERYAEYAISIENGRSVPTSPGSVVASGRVAS